MIRVINRLLKRIIRIRYIRRVNWRSWLSSRWIGVGQTVSVRVQLTVETNSSFGSEAWSCGEMKSDFRHVCHKLKLLPY